MPTKMQTRLSNLIAPIKPVLLWLLLWWLILYSLFSAKYVIRFDSQMLNYWIFIILALAIPSSLLWLALKNLKGSWFFIIVSASAICTLPIVVIVIFTLLDIRNLALNGKDESFEKIYELELDNNYYRLYRTNGGATTAYGLSLRKEKPLIMGLKLVDRISGFSPAFEGRLERLSQDKMRLIFLGRGGEGEQTYDFNL